MDKMFFPSRCRFDAECITHCIMTIGSHPLMAKKHPTLSAKTSSWKDALQKDPLLRGQAHASRPSRCVLAFSAQLFVLPKVTQKEVRRPRWVLYEVLDASRCHLEDPNIGPNIK